MDFERRVKKKIQQKLIVPLILLGFMVLMIMGSLFMTSMDDNKKAYLPAVEEDMVQRYKEVWELTGISWEEMIVFDTVRYENDFSKANPEETGWEFLIAKYIRHESPDKQIWQVSGSKRLTNKREILRFINDLKRFYNELSVTEAVAVLKEANMKIYYDSFKDLYERYEITIEYKDIEDVMKDANFTEEQLDWAYTLIADNVVQIMFGEAYELPDFIIVDGENLFAWPTPSLHEVTSPYGWRMHPIYGTRKFHAGVDIAGSGAMGSPVIASADGTVFKVVRDSSNDAGINIRIRHIDEQGNEWQTRYCHLSQISVSEGDQVQRGQVIGAVGSTGASTGPHLHFEMKYMGQLIDPYPYIH